MDLNKTLGQQSGNAKNHLDSVVIQCKQIKQLHEQFSEDFQNLLKQMQIFKQKVKNNPLELKKFLKQKLKPVENQLLVGQQNQKNQNKINQQIMTQIKRQNKQTFEAIIKTFQKLKIMEVKVGAYT